MKNITIALIVTATIITGCSTENQNSSTPQQPPAAQVPAKRGVVAVIARCSPDSTEVQRKYTQMFTDQLRSKLAADTTITTLPVTVTDTAISGLQIQGFVNGGDELHRGTF